MELEQKITAILGAVRAGIAKRVLDRGGKGKAVQKLEQGLSVSSEKIGEMYRVAIASLDPESQHKQAEKTPSEASQTSEGVRLSQAKVVELTTLRVEVKELRERIANLEQQLKTYVRDNKVCDTQDNKVEQRDNKVEQRDNKVSSTLLFSGSQCMGWKISEEKTVTAVETKAGKKHCTYLKWYAKKKAAGKLHRVYIGEFATKESAETKIKAYLEKHKLDL